MLHLSNCNYVIRCWRILTKSCIDQNANAPTFLHT